MRQYRHGPRSHHILSHGHPQTLGRPRSRCAQSPAEVESGDASPGVMQDRKPLYPAAWHPEQPHISGTLLCVHLGTQGHTSVLEHTVLSATLNSQHFPWSKDIVPTW